MKNLALIILSFFIAQSTFGSYSVPDKSITQRKLANRTTGTTVGAGGVAISGSSGSFSTSSNTPAAVTNMSITLTTTGRPVFVLVQSDGSGNPCDINPTANSNSWLQIYRGSTLLGYYAASSPSSSLFFPGVLSYVDAVSSGTYTYTFKVFTTTGSASVNINNCELVAFEL
jgi:hypothetical protein